MNKSDASENELIFSILDSKDTENIAKIGRALSSPQRVSILKALAKKPMNLLEISDALKMPVSSVSFNVDVLEDAKLVLVEYKPAIKGHMKLCSITNTSIHILMETHEEENNQDIVIEMPVGCYTEAKFDEGYLVSEKGFIYREKDCPDAIFNPERIKGQLFSFKSGHVIYDFPNYCHDNNANYKLSVSLEMCSEAPFYRNDWPSDITIWLNDIEIGTFTSPGDFGGKRGVFTPLFWKTESTQFGLLKTFSIDANGCYIDGVQVVNKNRIKDLNLDNSNTIRLKIGFKENAIHMGGINIFGRHFGNYAQDIVLTISKDIKDKSNYDL